MTDGGGFPREPGDPRLTPMCVWRIIWVRPWGPPTVSEQLSYWAGGVWGRRA